MINDREKDRCFYFRLVYVHSRFLANKGIFIDKKQKVAKVTGTILASTVRN